RHRSRPRPHNPQLHLGRQRRRHRFPHAAQVMRIRRDTLDRDGSLLAKEIVHGITTLDAARGTPDILAALTRGHWGIESVHWIRDTACAEDANTRYAGNGPQVMATLATSPSACSTSQESPG